MTTIHLLDDSAWREIHEPIRRLQPLATALIALLRGALVHGVIGLVRLAGEDRVHLQMIGGTDCEQ